jgi:ELWxxDGT repeat protein
MVKDINSGADGSGPGNLTDVNGTLFFTAFDPTHGRELWRSNGTAAGTRMVKDINPGAGSSIDLIHSFPLTRINGIAFFPARDGSDRRELWKSDGTAAGTTKVAQVAMGITHTRLRADLHGTLLFQGVDAIHGAELWKSDGTAAGTTLVKDIAPGDLASYPYDLTPFHGTLFFAADDRTHGRELWKSDGTEAGTTIVKDIEPGPSGSFPVPGQLSATKRSLFFTAFRLGHGLELWQTDGTSAGTTPVKGEGGAAPIVSATVDLATVGNTVFLAGHTPKGLFRTTTARSAALTSTKCE